MSQLVNFLVRNSRCQSLILFRVNDLSSKDSGFSILQNLLQHFAIDFKWKFIAPATAAAVVVAAASKMKASKSKMNGESPKSSKLWSKVHWKLKTFSQFHHQLNRLNHLPFSYFTLPSFSLFHFYFLLQVTPQSWPIMTWSMSYNSKLAYILYMVFGIWYFLLHLPCVVCYMLYLVSCVCWILSCCRIKKRKEKKKSRKVSVSPCEKTFHAMLCHGDQKWQEEEEEKHGWFLLPTDFTATTAIQVRMVVFTLCLLIDRDIELAFDALVRRELLQL